MALQALLYSNDAAFLSVFSRALTGLGVECLDMDEPQRYLDLIATENFDLLVIDCDEGSGGAEVLSQVRRASSNRDSVVMVGTAVRNPEAFLAQGANVILYKPLDPDMVELHLRNAYPLMLGERRRYDRHPLEMAVTVRTGDGAELRVTSLNLSEGGTALQLSQKLTPGQELEVEFLLPGESVPLQLSGKLAWMNTDLHAGVRFVRVAEESRQLLSDWLAKQAPSSAA